MRTLLEHELEWLVWIPAADKPHCFWVWFCRFCRALDHSRSMISIISLLPLAMMAPNRNWCIARSCVSQHVKFKVFVDSTCFVLDWTSKTGPCHELCWCIMEQLASEPLACLRGPSKSPWHPGSHPARLGLKEVLGLGWGICRCLQHVVLGGEPPPGP